MADYSTIKGFTIQSLATDPYATSIASGAWASGGTMSTGRDGAAGFGNPAATTAIVAGGYVTAPGAYTLDTESYDGTSWTEVNNLNGTAVGMAGATGTSTAGLYYGGQPVGGSPYSTDVTQEFDGTSWAAVNNMQSQVRDLSAGGTQTAAFAALGGLGPSFITTAQTYDGTSWTTANSCNTARRTGTGSGTVTAGLVYGGYIGPAYSGDTESYDGTSWTEVNNMNKLAGNLGGTHSGTNTAALAVGGYGGPPGSARFATNEYFDGTSWTELADISTARSTNAGGGTSTDAFIATGYTDSSSPYSLTSEFWSLADPLTLAQEGQVWYNTTSTVLKGFAQAGTGAWASGGDINTARTQCGSAGTQDAALQFLGESPYADKNRTEEYDGTSWTETNNCNTARQSPAVTIGTQTTAIAAGGNPGGSLNEQYDGSCWAEGADLNSSAYSKGGAGSSTAGMAWGGASPSVIASNEEWNGTSWSEVNNINTARKMCNGAGTQTAAVTAGGQSPPFVAITETWDGTSWTEVGNLNANCTEYSSANAGSSTAWMQYGGARPALAATCEEWNGTSWSAVASMATARQAVGGGGTTLAGLVAGSNAPLTAACEEFTVPYATKTFTAS